MRFAVLVAMVAGMFWWFSHLIDVGQVEARRAVDRRTAQVERQLGGEAW